MDHDILVNLAADKCPGLAGKPKLVFVQACQGQATDPGSSVRGEERRRRHTSTDSSTPAYKIPNYSPVLSKYEIIYLTYILHLFNII